jgi:uncharacterized protein DUF3300
MAEAAGIISIATLRYRVPAVAAAFALLAVGPGVNPAAFAQQVPQQAQPQQAQQQFTVQQINQLVAPIALYPDNLLGQILAASTYPLDIVVAARWSSSNQNVTGTALEDAMQLQSWDPSVKALTAVPQVLQMMSEKLEWTQQLGAAYLGQPDDIAASVQRLRARADASGNLKETKQIKVRREAAPPPPPAYVGEPLPPEYIVIEPYEPDYLYVPVYDPWVVYGVWPYPAWRPFYWYPPGYVAVGIIGFGAPCIVGAAIWANYSWRSRSVVVDVHRFESFHRTKLASTGGGTQTWNHKSEKFSSKALGQGLKGGAGSPQTFTGKPTGFNASGPSGQKPDGQRHTTFNPNGGSKTPTNLTGQGTKTVGTASITNQNGGTNKFHSNNGNGTIKTNSQKVTASQSFKPATNFKPPTSYKPATSYKPVVRAQQHNNKP